VSRHFLVATLLAAMVMPWVYMPLASAAEERLSVVSNDEVVGTLVATSDGDRTRIAYQVRNNGRGPTIQETLQLRQGIPVAWNVDGTTAFGGPATENMRWQSGRLTWQSQADRGSVTAKQPLLYVSNNGSPWALGVYARALLAVTPHALSVAPSGRMQLDSLGERQIGDQVVHAYALTGINLTPDLLLLDGQLRLFATLDEGASLAVRTGYEKHYRDLLAWSHDIQFAQLEKRQTQLAHRFTQPVRFRNVRIFDPRKGAIGAPVSVVVFRGRIASVDEESAANTSNAGEVIVDGEGGTLIPGLHDMHSHSTPWTGLFYLAAGVTSVRDNGNNNDELLDLSERIDGGSLPGPRIWRAGLLEGRSPYSARIGRIADNLPDALASVRWYADRGYRMIKIYNSLNPDWVQPVAAEAHRLGLRVNGHVPAFSSPDRVILDGYDEITHINQLNLGWVLKAGEDTRTPLRLTALGERGHQIDLQSQPVHTTLELMKTRRIAFDPTLVILERLMMSRSGQAMRPTSSTCPSAISATASAHSSISRRRRKAACTNSPLHDWWTRCANSTPRASPFYRAPTTPRASRCTGNWNSMCRPAFLRRRHCAWRR
jgi:hypothetical protein